jgi:hypothetical protein
LVRPMLVVSMLSYSGLHSALRKARLMTLLIHLGVLSVGRLRITAIVTIGTVVCVAIWGSILSHALRKAWALRAILRRGIIARGCRLVPDGRELRVWRSLSGHTDGLSHLTIDGSPRCWTSARWRSSSALRRASSSFFLAFHSFRISLNSVRSTSQHDIARALMICQD